MTAPPAPAMALLLLADGRFPTGGHAHSAGVEAAVAEGRIAELATLEAWIRGRLPSTGLVDATLAASTVTELSRLDEEGAGRHERACALGRLDGEAGARLACEPLRDASRRLGRQLGRIGARCWPGETVDALVAAAPGGAHQSVAFGAVCQAAGLDGLDTTRLVTHHLVSTATQAAVRLLGLDPFGAAALQAGLADESERIARLAAALGAGPVNSLPALSGPIADIAAIDHAGAEGRLFAT